MEEEERAYECEEFYALRAKIPPNVENGIIAPPHRRSLNPLNSVSNAHPKRRSPSHPHWEVQKCPVLGVVLK